MGEREVKRIPDKVVDLDPGSYKDRKPDGWRWKLPWAHPDDVKLPMVMFFVTLGIFGTMLLTANFKEPQMMFTAAIVGIGCGCMLMLWLRD